MGSIWILSSFSDRRSNFDRRYKFTLRLERRHDQQLPFQLNFSDNMKEVHFIYEAIEVNAHLKT